MASEEKYIAGAKAGDEDAFSALVRLYETRVYHFILRMVRNPDDALDLAQETFLRVYRSLDLFRGESSFATWIFSIAHHLCVDFSRKQARKHRFSFHTLEDEVAQTIADERPGPEAALENKLLAHEIDRALNGVSPEMREIFLLREVSGLQYAEIADLLDLELGTVKSRIARARVALQKELRKIRNNSKPPASNEKEER